MRVIDATTKRERDVDATDNGLKVDFPATQTIVPGNPSTVARGSQTATNSAVALGAATAYTGGIDIWNADSTNRVAIGGAGVTDAAGSGKIILGPGQGYHEPSGDLSALYIIAASGSPIVSWVGSTL